MSSKLNFSCFPGIFNRGEENSIILRAKAFCSLLDNGVVLGMIVTFYLQSYI